jgi:hypothetical protein
MQFVMLYRPAAGDAGGPTPECAGRVAALTEEMLEKGVLLSMGGCMPTAHGAKVHLSEGKATVTDGPFTEAKEIVAGFCLIQAGSLEEAAGWARRFMEIAGDGETEIRQLFSQDHLDGRAARSESPREISLA